MHIVVSERVAKEYGARIRAVDPDAKLLVLGVREGKATWKGDPAKAEVCCFSVDFWSDMDLRNVAIPQLFRLDRLRWFHSFSAGVDAQAFQVIIDRGAILTNSSGASAPAIAQHVLAMMLYHARRLGEMREQQRRSEWTPLPAFELTGLTAGVVGTGAIGAEVARLAKACGMRVIGTRRTPRPTRNVDEVLPPGRLRQLLRRSDFVVLACPLTKQTEGLIGAAELAAMKPSAALINIARGRIVDEPALVEALRSGALAAAYLDVFVNEPLPPESPLWDMPNVLVTPHNAGSSPLNMERSMAIFLDNLARLVAGRKLRNVIERAGVG